MDAVYRNVLFFKGCASLHLGLVSHVRMGRKEHTSLVENIIIHNHDRSSAKLWCVAWFKVGIWSGVGSGMPPRHRFHGIDNFDSAADL